MRSSIRFFPLLLVICPGTYSYFIGTHRHRTAGRFVVQDVRRLSRQRRHNNDDGVVVNGSSLFRSSSSPPPPCRVPQGGHHRGSSSSCSSSQRHVLQWDDVATTDHDFVYNSNSSNNTVAVNFFHIMTSVNVLLLWFLLSHGGSPVDVNVPSGEVVCTAVQETVGPTYYDEDNNNINDAAIVWMDSSFGFF